MKIECRGAIASLLSAALVVSAPGMECWAAVGRVAKPAASLSGTAAIPRLPPAALAAAPSSPRQPGISAAGTSAGTSIEGTSPEAASNVAAQAFDAASANLSAEPLMDAVGPALPPGPAMDLRLAADDSQAIASFTASFHEKVARAFPSYEFTVRDYYALARFTRYFTPSMGVREALRLGASYVYGDRLEEEEHLKSFQTQLAGAIGTLSLKEPRHGLDQAKASELLRLAEPAAQEMAPDADAPFQVPLAGLIPDKAKVDLVLTPTTLRRIEAAYRAFAMRDYALLLGPPATQKSAIPKYLAAEYKIPHLAVTMHPGIGTFELVGGYRPKVIQLRGIAEARAVIKAKLAESRGGSDYSELLESAVKVYGGISLTALLASVEADLADAQRSPEVLRRLTTLAHGIEFGSSSLVWQDGYLTYALKHDIWITFEEINAAPTESQEFLNDFMRTRRLVVTQKLGEPEVVGPRAGGRFMLWATMNPETDPNREVLAQTLKNRWRVKYFGHLPALEQAEIIEKKYGLPSTWALALVENFHKELHRQAVNRVIGDAWRDGYEVNLRHLLKTARRWRAFVDQETANGRAPDKKRQLFLLGREAYSVYAGMMRTDNERAGVFTMLDQALKLSAAGVAGADALRVKPALIEDLGDLIRLGDVVLPKGKGGVWVPKPNPDYLADASVLERLYEYAKALSMGEPLLLMGESAAGKTSDLEYLFFRLNMNLRYKNLDSDTAIEEVIGGYTTGRRRGQFVYQEGMLPQAMEEGSGAFLDEFNLNALVEWLNTVVDDGRLYLPHRIVEGRPLLVAAANPPEPRYPGRVLLSPATRSRYTEFWVPKDNSVARLQRLMDHWLKGGTMYASVFLAGAGSALLNLVLSAYGGGAHAVPGLAYVPGRSRGDFSLIHDLGTVPTFTAIAFLTLSPVLLYYSQILGGLSMLAGVATVVAGLRRSRRLYRTRPLASRNVKILRQANVPPRLLANDQAARFKALQDLTIASPYNDPPLAQALASMAFAETSPQNVKQALEALGAVGGAAAQAELNELKNSLPEYTPQIAAALRAAEARAQSMAAVQEAAQSARVAALPDRARLVLAAAQAELARLAGQAGLLATLRAAAVSEKKAALEAALASGDTGATALATRALAAALETPAAADAGRNALPAASEWVKPVAGQSLGNFSLENDFIPTLVLLGNIIFLLGLLAAVEFAHLSSSGAILGIIVMVITGRIWTNYIISNWIDKKNSAKPLARRNARALRRAGARSALIHNNHAVRFKALQDLAASPSFADPELARVLAGLAIAETTPQNVKQALEALGAMGGAPAQAELDGLKRLLPAYGSQIEAALRAAGARAAAMEAVQEAAKASRGAALPDRARVVLAAAQAELARLAGQAGLLATLRAAAVGEKKATLEAALASGDASATALATRALAAALETPAAGDAGRNALPASDDGWVKPVAGQSLGKFSPKKDFGNRLTFVGLGLIPLGFIVAEQILSLGVWFFSGSVTAILGGLIWSLQIVQTNKIKPLAAKNAKALRRANPPPGLIDKKQAVRSQALQALAMNAPYGDPQLAKIVAGLAAAETSEENVRQALIVLGSIGGASAQGELNELKKILPAEYRPQIDIALDAADARAQSLDAAVQQAGEAGLPTRAHAILAAAAAELAGLSGQAGWLATLRAAAVSQKKAALEVALASDDAGATALAMRALAASLETPATADPGRSAVPAAAGGWVKPVAGQSLGDFQQKKNKVGESLVFCGAISFIFILIPLAVMGIKIGALLFFATAAAVPIGMIWSSHIKGANLAKPLASVNLKILRQTNASPRLLANDHAARFKALQDLAASPSFADPELARVLAGLAIAETTPQNVKQALEALGAVGGAPAQAELSQLKRLLPAYERQIEAALRRAQTRAADMEPVQETAKTSRVAELPDRARAILAAAEAELARLAGQAGLLATLRAAAVGEKKATLEAALASGDASATALATRALAAALETPAALDAGRNALPSSAYNPFAWLRRLFGSKKKASEPSSEAELALPPTLDELLKAKGIPPEKWPEMKAKVARVQTVIRMVGSSVGRDSSTKWAPGDLWAFFPDQNMATYPFEHLVTHSEEQIVGLTDHEGSHREITVLDQRFPLVRKYMEDPIKHFLWNGLEDPRVNSRSIHRLPGSERYLFSAYDRYLPKDFQASPGKDDAGEPDPSSLGDGASAFNAEVLRYPHIEFVMAANYYWRHGQKPPRFFNTSVEQAFDKALPDMQQVFDAYPRDADPSQDDKLAYSMEALKRIDEKILPLYEPLVKESEKKVSSQMKGKKKGKGKNDSKGKSGGTPLPSENEPQAKPDPNKEKTDPKARRALEEHARNAARELGSKIQDNPKRRAPSPRGSDPAKLPTPTGEAGTPGTKEPAALTIEDIAQTQRDQALNRASSSYQRAFEPVAHLSNPMVTRLENVFQKNARARDVGWFQRGKRLDVKRYMKRHGEGGVRDDYMLRRTQKTKRRYKVTILIDESESMEGFRQEAIRSVVLLVDSLSRLQIDTEVIGFSDAARVHKDFKSPLTAAVKDNLVAELQAHLGKGGTHDADAVKLAVERLRLEDAEKRFIFVVTDGEGNGKSKLADVLPQAEAAGIYVTGIGVGAGMAHVRTAYPHHVAVERIEDMPATLKDTLVEYIQRQEQRAYAGSGGRTMAFLAAGTVSGRNAIPAGASRWRMALLQPSLIILGVATAFNAAVFAAVWAASPWILQHGRFFFFAMIVSGMLSNVAAKSRSPYPWTRRWGIAMFACLSAAVAVGAFNMSVPVIGFLVMSGVYASLGGGGELPQYIEQRLGRPSGRALRELRQAARKLTLDARARGWVKALGADKRSRAHALREMRASPKDAAALLPVLRTLILEDPVPDAGEILELAASFNDDASLLLLREIALRGAHPLARRAAELIARAETARAEAAEFERLAEAARARALRDVDAVLLEKARAALAAGPEPTALGQRLRRAALRAALETLEAARSTGDRDAAAVASRRLAELLEGAGGDPGRLAIAAGVGAQPARGMGRFTPANGRWGYLVPGAIVLFVICMLAGMSWNVILAVSLPMAIAGVYLDFRAQRLNQNRPLSALAQKTLEADSEAIERRLTPSQKRIWKQTYSGGLTNPRHEVRLTAIGILAALFPPLDHKGLARFFLDLAVNETTPENFNAAVEVLGLTRKDEAIPALRELSDLARGGPFEAKIGEILAGVQRLETSGARSLTALATNTSGEDLKEKAQGLSTRAAAAADHLKSSTGVLERLRLAAIEEERRALLEAIAADRPENIALAVSRLDKLLEGFAAPKATAVFLGGARPPSAALAPFDPPQALRSGITRSWLTAAVSAALAALLAAAVPVMLLWPAAPLGAAALGAAWSAWVGLRLTRPQPGWTGIVQEAPRSFDWPVADRMAWLVKRLGIDPSDAPATGLYKGGSPDPRLQGLNAYSGGKSLGQGMVAVGERWVEQSPEALTAVLAHELGHLWNRDTIWTERWRRLQRLAFESWGVSAAASLALAPLLGWTLLLSLFLPTGVMLAASAFAAAAYMRLTEQRADLFAAWATEPRWTLSFLEVFASRAPDRRIGFLERAASSHPSIADRAALLRELAAQAPRDINP